jgi:hypothetical protein
LPFGRVRDYFLGDFGFISLFLKKVEKAYLGEIDK